MLSFTEPTGDRKGETEGEIEEREGLLFTYKGWGMQER
jgi:hypothetical protein